jgi:hypothetical protein
MTGTTSDSNTTHALFATAGAPAFRQPILTDIGAGVAGAGTYDFSAATMEIPEALGFTANVNSTIGLDTTNNNTHLWENGADALAVAETAAIAANTIPKATNSTNSLMTASGLIDNGTTISTSEIVTLTGNLNCTVVNKIPCVSDSNPQGWAGANCGAWIQSAMNSITNGTVDARGCVTTPVATAEIDVPANIILLLPPVPMTFNVGANCFVKLTGNGAEIKGQLSASQTQATSSWVGTVLQALTPGASTKGVCVTPGVENVGVDGVAVDMVPAGGATTAGSDCFNTLGMSNSTFNNIFGYHCGGNGFIGGSSTTSHYYDNTITHATMRFVALDYWLLTTSNGTVDIDRFYCLNCSAHAFDASSNVTRSGTNGVHLQIPPGAAAAQSIVDIIFSPIFVFGTVSGATNYGLFLDNQSVNSYIKNVFAPGEIEGGFSNDAGIGIHSNGDATHLVDAIFLEPMLLSNWTTGNDLTSIDANNFRISDQASGVTYGSSFLFKDRTTLGGTTTTPGGGLVFASSSGGVYRWNTDSGGALTMQRTDVGPTDIWIFQQQLNQIYPATDSLGSFGLNNKRWLNSWIMNGNFGTTLLPIGAGGVDLGSTALPFGNLWLGTAATNNFKFQPASTTGARIITIADPLSPTTVGLPLQIASGTSTMASGAITAATCAAAITTSATGVLTTDAIDWSYATAPALTTDALLHISPYVTAGNVNFTRCNATASSITGTAIVLNWRVRR